MKKADIKNCSNTEAGDIYRLFRLLGQTDDAITRCRETELRKYGITPEQAAALICIHSIGKKATPAEVSRWLFREANSVLVLLRRMEKLGLIKRTADTKNRHFTRIALTEKGYEAYRHAIEFYAFYDIIRVLTPRRRQQLWALLEMLRTKAFENLGLDITPYSRSLGQELIIDSDDPSTGHSK